MARRGKPERGQVANPRPPQTPLLPVVDAPPPTVPCAASEPPFDDGDAPPSETLPSRTDSSTTAPSAVSSPPSPDSAERSSIAPLLREATRVGGNGLQKADGVLRHAAGAVRWGWFAFYEFVFAYLEGRASITSWYPLVVERHTTPLSTEVPVVADGARRAVAAGAADGPIQTRLVSLDAFRGLTILGMLLVNNVALAGATPLNLTHANWNNAVHFADVIFPWFLLIVGVALPLSWASHVAKNGTMPLYVRRVLLRTAGLFALGCFVDSTVARQVTVGLGVLQLIGLAYAMGALILPRVGPKRRLLLALGLLALHGLFLQYGPLPAGSGAGRFTQSGNVVETLNVAFLSSLGLRGLLSVIPTGAMVLLGSVVGDLLRRDHFVPTRKSVLLSVLGALFVLLGALWSIGLPFSKPLWTGSYILYTAGWGVLMLGAFYLLADAYQSRRIVFPLVVPGTNAIFVYVASIFVKVSILETWRWRIGDAAGGVANPLVEQAILSRFSALFGRVGGGWLYTAAYILIWWLVLLWMYRRRLFLRV